MKVLIVTADGFEDAEVSVPAEGLSCHGIDFDIAAPHAGPIRGKHGSEITAGKSIRDVRADEYDGLILPGGRAPATLRTLQSVLDLVRAFAVAGKPIAAICHGPQVLVSAGLLRGRRATGYRGIAGELRRAGAEYENSEVVVDDNFVTSRQPGDLSAFMRETLRQLGADNTVNVTV